MSDIEEAPTAISRWFGYDRIQVGYDDHPVDITVGSADAWDRAHLRRLRQSSDLPGLVPVIDADVSSDGLPYVVTATINQPTFDEILKADKVPSWHETTGITEAAARSCHNAHERGLYHGALTPEDVFVVDNAEVALQGLGLTRGGDVPNNKAQWIAPEILGGEEPTARSDVYSLGKILEAALSSASGTIPRSVKRLIMWSSSETPEARPRSAAEFAEILSDGLGESRTSYVPAFIPTTRAPGLTEAAEIAVATATTEPPGNDEAAGGEHDKEIASELAVIDGTGQPKTDEEQHDERLQVTDDTDESSDEDEGSLNDDGDDEVAASPQETDQLAILDLPKGPTEDETESNGQLKESVASAAAARTTEHINGKSKHVVADEPVRDWTRFLIPLLLMLAIPLLTWVFWQGGGSDDEVANETTNDSIASPVIGDAPDTETPKDSETPNADSITAEPPTDPAAPSTRVVPVSSAAIQIVHGIPETPVDIYVDDELTAANFEPQSVAGPLELPAGTYDVVVFGSSDDPPSSADDRSDAAIIDLPGTALQAPMTLVAHRDTSGTPTITAFPENHEALPAGSSRLIVRNVATGSNEAMVGIDGTSESTLNNGEELALQLDPGHHDVVLTNADGDAFFATSIPLLDGELTAITVGGDATSESATAVVQRYSGLGSAPVEVPTGDSGLAGSDSTSNFWLVCSITAMMLLSGFFITSRRRNRK